MASEMPEIFYAFGPHLNALMSVGIFVESSSSLSEVNVEFRSFGSGSSSSLV